MDKFIVVGDIHVSFNGPKRRESNYYTCLINKLKQIRDLQKENDNCPVICLGDFFDTKVAEHLEKMIFDLSPLLKNWYSLIGNHDNHKENGSDLRGTSFGLLNESGFLKLGKDFSKKYNKDNISYDFYDYYKREDYHKNKKDNKDLKIAFIHDYIMPSGTNVNYEFKECKENDYNIVFCGHYHYNFDEIKGKTRFINPGCLMRTTIAKDDINRTPQVILVDFSKEDPIIYHKLKYNSSESVFEQNNNILDNTFDSKFTEMLLKNDLTTSSSNDIIEILKKNNVEDSIISYIEEKNKEVEQND